MKRSTKEEETETSSTLLPISYSQRRLLLVTNSTVHLPKAPRSNSKLAFLPNSNRDFWNQWDSHSAKKTSLLWLWEQTSVEWCEDEKLKVGDAKTIAKDKECWGKESHVSYLNIVLILALYFDLKANNSSSHSYIRIPFLLETSPIYIYIFMFCGSSNRCMQCAIFINL
jgi:hypothetical protein